MGYNVYNRTKAVKALNTGARTNGTVTGTTVDRLAVAGNAFGSVCFVVLSETLTDGVHTLSVEESDDNSSWASAAAGDQTAAVATVAAQNNLSFEVGYHGAKRYCRLKVVTTGATTGGVIEAVAILGMPRHEPVR